MSEKIILRSSTLSRSLERFIGLVFRKYGPMPPADNDETLSLQRLQYTRDFGVSEETLNECESYLKKVAVGVIPHDEDRFQSIVQKLTDEVMAFYIKKADGKTVELVFDTELPDIED